MIGACRDRVVQRSRRRRRIQKPAVPERAAGRRRERRGGATIKLKATPTEFTGPKRLPPTHRRWLDPELLPCTSRAVISLSLGLLPMVRDDAEREARTTHQVERIFSPIANYTNFINASAYALCELRIQQMMQQRTHSRE